MRHRRRQCRVPVSDAVSKLTMACPSSRCGIQVPGVASKKTTRHRGSATLHPISGRGVRVRNALAETATSRRSSRCSIQSHDAASKFPMACLERRRAVAISKCAVEAPDAASCFPAWHREPGCGIVFLDCLVGIRAEAQAVHPGFLDFGDRVVFHYHLSPVKRSLCSRRKCQPDSPVRSGVSIPSFLITLKVSGSRFCPRFS
jgi:hypothetical protein